MRTRLALSLSLFVALSVLAGPARGAVEFRGMNTRVNGLTAGLSWSSDLGTGYTSVVPFAFLQQGVTLVADTLRNLEGGPVEARATGVVAPAGLVSASTGPVYRFDGFASAINTSSGYGRFAATETSPCLLFTPPGAGATLYWAIRWVRTRQITGGGVSSALYIASPFETFTFTGPDTGTVFRTQVGTIGSLCSFDFRTEANVPAGFFGSASVRLLADIYLDSAPIVSVGGATPAALRFAPARPNPTRAQAMLAFELPREGEVEVQVIDLAGRVVQSLLPGRLPAGSHTLDWQPRAADGRPLARGVYFARLMLSGDAGTESRQQRIVLVD